MAVSSHLHSVLGLSYGKVAALFDQLYGLHVVPSTLVRRQASLASKAESVYGEIEILVQQAPVVYPDETGWKVEALLGWLWVFVSKDATLYTIRPSRGQDVILDVLSEDFSGKIGHDGWRSYDVLAKALHQTCLAHLLRRCAEMLDGATGGAVRFPRHVKSLLLDSLQLRDRRDQGLLSAHGLASAIGRLEARKEDLLECSPTYEPNRLLRNHLERVQDQLFPFLKHPDLEATNWPSEQAIRPAVVNRKVCGGNRSWSGARALEILISICRTCVQQGRDAIQFLTEVLRTPTQFPLPSILSGP